MKLLFEEIVNELLNEQENTSQEVFTPQQQKFLGKFAEKNSQSLGILYSTSPEGIEEFILRSGEALQLTPETFNYLIDSDIISIEQIGTRRDPMYTISLNIPISSIAAFAETGDGETGDAETTPDIDMSTSTGGGGGGMTTADLDTTDLAGGTETPEAETETPGAETPEADETEPIPATGAEESFRKDGDLILEYKRLNIYKYKSILEQSARSLKHIIHEQSKSPKVYSSNSRVLNRLPAGYIYYLERIIELMSKRLHSDLEKEHLVADLLDNLAFNFGLTPNQILRSYVFYKNQNKLRAILKK
jgi:hypothetical protein